MTGSARQVHASAWEFAGTVRPPLSHMLSRNGSLVLSLFLSPSHAPAVDLGT